MYNKIVPSAEAKEPSDSEARRHLNRAGDAAKDAGEDIKTSAYEVKEALKDGARGYGNTLQDRYASCLNIAFPNHISNLVHHGSCPLRTICSASEVKLRLFCHHLLDQFLYHTTSAPASQSML